MADQLAELRVQVGNAERNGETSVSLPVFAIDRLLYELEERRAAEDMRRAQGERNYADQDALALIKRRVASSTPGSESFYLRADAVRAVVEELELLRLRHEYQGAAGDMERALLEARRQIAALQDNKSIRARLAGLLPFGRPEAA